MTDETKRIIKAYEDNGYRVDVRPFHPWGGPDGLHQVSLVYPAAPCGSAARVAASMLVTGEAPVPASLVALAIKIDRLRVEKLAASIEAAIAVSANERREHEYREMSRRLAEMWDAEAGR